MATTRKKTTSAAPVAEVTEKEIVEVKAVEETVTPVAAEAPAKAKRKFAPDDLILCRSVTTGTLLLVGKKTRSRYKWVDYDDCQYMEYQDLISELLTNSGYIYKPLFVIEDEDLLSDPKWARLNKLYESLYDMGDIQELLDLPYGRFAAILPNLPLGLKNAVKGRVSTLISQGEFDSLNKIKLIDEVCGSDLKCMVS